MTSSGRPRIAIIPLAGRATRHRPASLATPKGLFPLVDLDGRTKPVIHLMLDEAFHSGIERVCLVTGPGEDGPFRRYLDAVRTQDTPPAWPTAPGAISFAVQPTPEGYGHAVLCARDATAGEPALIMLGDHFYLSVESRRCAAQLLDAFATLGASVSAVQRTPEAELHLFGTILGEPHLDHPGAYRVRRIIEKPSPDVARAELRTPGLADGQYLCWFGLHAMSATIFDVLANDVAHDRREHGEFQLTGAQARLAAREPYYAHEVAGARHDMGDPDAYLAAQAALTAARNTR
ncbi:MAG: UTP--glucose-1-phosphate uridylyltransferase [uncultured Chloroflexi bacterium]|uniref:UTP--glucose-1-phosphate uridylyltransferase n=1 Tax=uncultured Chloroflexota bacterium TaxID=166587 RepID=A0A6J4JD83_9CHLR|nr:MAG: UTP--glucose-1-phosphate uridylyltransferase [uncultured Chloroflexota bacterium]